MGEPAKKRTPSAIPENEGHLSLRHRALLFYCYENQASSIASMSQQAPFNQVALRTLECWSAADRWQERRQQAQERWAIRVQERIGNQLVQKRVDQLRSLEKLDVQIGEFLESGSLEFKSLESGISALVRLAQCMDDLREKVLGDLPRARPQTPEKALVPDLTPDEAREAAKAILEIRRNRMSAESATKAYQAEYPDVEAYIYGCKPN